MHAGDALERGLEITVRSQEKFRTNLLLVKLASVRQVVQIYKCTVALEYPVNFETYVSKIGLK